VPPDDITRLAKEGHRIYAIIVPSNASELLSAFLEMQIVPKLSVIVLDGLFL
jgi:hypothetical protein